MTYKIVRYYRENRKPRVTKRGLTLEEAKKHTNNPKTASKNFFDGFTKE